MPDIDVYLPQLPEAVDFISGYFARGTPRVGDLVFDAGAYCGETTLALAAVVGESGRVVAFEPGVENRHWLRYNLRCAGFKNVVICERPLWGDCVKVNFSQRLGPDAHVTSSARSLSKVQAVTFEQAVQQFGLPSFVKMDVEGAETRIIESASEFIAKHNIHFAIASYHLENGATTSKTLERLFRNMGYAVATGNEQHLTTWAWKEEAAEYRLQ